MITILLGVLFIGIGIAYYKETGLPIIRLMADILIIAGVCEIINGLIELI